MQVNLEIHRRRWKRRKSCDCCRHGTFVRHGWQFCMKETQHWWLLSEGTIFCLTANWLRQEIFPGWKQQYIAALCGALTRILCRPLQPLETSSCYQVAQLAAKDLIDLLWMWYTNSLSNHFPSVFPPIFFILFFPTSLLQIYRFPNFSFPKFSVYV